MATEICTAKECKQHKGEMAKHHNITIFDAHPFPPMPRTHTVRQTLYYVVPLQQHTRFKLNIRYVLVSLS